MICTDVSARTISVDGLRVRMIEAVPERERDEPVLLIHGLGGWAGNWSAVMPAIVWGGEDRILPASLVEDVRLLAPDAEVRVIPSCGHLVMVERPREFTDAFLPFLDRASHQEWGGPAGGGRPPPP